MPTTPQPIAHCSLVISRPPNLTTNIVLTPLLAPMTFVAASQARMNPAEHSHPKFLSAGTMLVRQLDNLLAFMATEEQVGQLKQLVATEATSEVFAESKSVRSSLKSAPT
jgi:hypothetical protein